MKRSDRYSVACNEDIVADCCDEPRLPLRRNTPESPETRVSIIAGHTFWEETEIKQSRKQTAEVTLPYPNLFEELKDKNPDQFWMFSLNSRIWLIQNVKRRIPAFPRVHFVERSCAPLSLKLGADVKAKLSHHRSPLYQPTLCSYHFPGGGVMLEERVCQLHRYSLPVV